MGSIDRSQKNLKILITTAFIGLAGCAGSPPNNLGVTNSQLAPCPSSPNCVSSYATDKDKKVAPWIYNGTQEQAQKKLVELLQAKENVTLIEDSPSYIRAEFETALMGFVDDVEFVIEDGIVKMRSASRVGYSDLGANKDRIDALQKEFLPCCN